MSYPPDLYHGDNGEVSGHFRPGGQEPELPMKSSAASYLLTGATTGGRIGLYRWDFLGPRSGPDPHFHRSMSESFFILSGTVRLYDGSRWRDGEPGDFLHVPEGGIHGFRNESGEPASMLLMFSPGGPREAYFEGLAAGIGGLSDEERAAFLLEHDNHFL